MNPAYFGDSYDLVKRFFCRELSVLGYLVEVDAMLTGSWSGTEDSFYRLIGAPAHGKTPTEGGPRALLVDPGTVNLRGQRELFFKTIHGYSNA